MIVLKLLLWVIFGFGAMCVALAVHWVMAAKKGYDPIGWWEKNTPPPFGSFNDVLRFIFGMIIWPVRLYQFVRDIPWYYEQYELNQ